ncbi:MAG: arginase family protein [Bacteroidales bacterium]|nr:arginase family protein [Bacteroidales bacterium]
MIQSNVNQGQRSNSVIIECPTNLGLSKKPYANEPGVKRLPMWLKKWGFHAAITPNKIISIEAPEYSANIDPETDVRNAGAIINYAIKQSEIIANKIHNDSFLIVLGGDCSVLVGTSIALRKMGRFGLFFLDGHTDYIKPEQSHTHGAAGMDLAIACGYGHPNLTNILNLCPYIEQQNVFCVGNREYDDDYEMPIKESQVTYIPLNELRKRSIKKTVIQFLNMIEKHKLDGFFIHFDVDVLDDTIMPAVDSRENDGLSYFELEEILTPLIGSNKAFGMEITILDPDLDPNGSYTRDFIKIVTPIINKLK